MQTFSYLNESTVLIEDLHPYTEYLISVSSQIQVRTINETMGYWSKNATISLRTRQSGTGYRHPAFKGVMNQ